MTARPDPAATPRAPLDLPRDQWEDHPHFPSQTLLLGSHEGFRRTSRMLLTYAIEGTTRAAIGAVFRAWKSMMRAHEAYEETKLYPYLEARWSLSTADAEEGHHALQDAERDVLAHLDGNGPASPELVRALQIHDRVLHRHLRIEESIVIPALLALEPEEFAAYSTRSIERLLHELGDPDSSGS